MNPNPFEKLSSEGLPPGPELPAPKQPKLGRVVLRREKAHRGGKTVVIIYDFATHIPVSQVEAIATKLKKSVGCGGTVKGREIEIQGDQPAKIRALLEAEGFRVAGI